MNFFVHHSGILILKTKVSVAIMNVVYGRMKINDSRDVNMIVGCGGGVGASLWTQYRSELIRAQLILAQYKLSFIYSDLKHFHRPLYMLSCFGLSNSGVDLWAEPEN